MAAIIPELIELAIEEIPALVSTAETTELSTAAVEPVLGSTTSDLIATPLGEEEGAALPLPGAAASASTNWTAVEAILQEEVMEEESLPSSLLQDAWRQATTGPQRRTPTWNRPQPVAFQDSEQPQTKDDPHLQDWVMIPDTVPRDPEAVCPKKQPQGKVESGLPLAPLHRPAPPLDPCSEQDVHSLSPGGQQAGLSPSQGATTTQTMTHLPGSTMPTPEVTSVITDSSTLEASGTGIQPQDPRQMQISVGPGSKMGGLQTPLGEAEPSLRPPSIGSQSKGGAFESIPGFLRHQPHPLLRQRPPLQLAGRPMEPLPLSPPRQPLGPSQLLRQPQKNPPLPQLPPLPLGQPLPAQQQQPPQLPRQPPLPLVAQPPAPLHQAQFVQLKRPSRPPQTPPIGGGASSSIAPILDGTRVWRVHDARDLVRYGDHSVRTDLSAEQGFCDVPVDPEEEGDFISTFRDWASTADDRVTNVAPTIGIGSYTSRRTIGGGMHAPVFNRGGVIHYLPAAITPITAAMLPTRPSVRWQSSKWLGRISDTNLSSFKNGGVINERAVHSAIVPWLQYINPADLRNVSGLIDLSPDIYDNMGFYAKGIWMALAQDHTVYSGGVCDNNGVGGAAFSQIAMNIAPAAGGATIYRELEVEIRRGALILREGKEFSDAEVQFIQWLAQSGRRLNVAAGQVASHMMALDWPAIPICLMHWRVAAIPPPAAANIASRDMWAFMRRIANIRNEQSAYQRALYWVMAHCGIRLAEAAPVIPPIYGHVFPSFSAGHAHLPMPFFHNILYVALKIFPATSPQSILDSDAWDSLSAAGRVRMATLFQACYNAFFTTMLASQNIPLQQLLNYQVNVAPQVVPDTLGPLMTLLTTLTTPPDEATGACLLLAHPLSGFPRFMGTKVPSTTMWGGRYGSGAPGSIVLADINNGIAGRVLDRPPQWHSPAVVDDFLTLRPMEWGWPGYVTIADFSKEIIQLGRAARRGWHSCMGTSRYAASSTSTIEGQFVEYGILAHNVLCQYWELDGTRVDDLYQRAPGFTDNPDVEYGAAAIAPPDFWAANFVHQPCSIMSYDWVDMTVNCPALLTAQMNGPLLRATVDWGSKLLDGVGLMPSQVQRTPSSHLGSSQVQFAGFVRRAPTTSPAVPFSEAAPLAGRQGEADQ